MIPNDADLETIGLHELANQRAHAIRHGYCLDCDTDADPNNTIGDLGLCLACERDYLGAAE